MAFCLWGIGGRWAQIFLSYAWGVRVVRTDGVRDYNRLHITQELVRAVRRAVELESGALCWLDVGGGLCAGQNHLDRMRCGMERAYAAVVFFSDGYVKSANCRREMHMALSSFKHVVPVLLPPAAIDPEKWEQHEYSSREHLEAAVRDSGWGGPCPAPENWWQHAVGLCAELEEGCATPEGDLIDWSALAEFPPLDLRTAAATFAGGGVGGLSLERVESLLSLLMGELRLGARLMARLSPSDCFTEVRKAHQGWRNLKVLKNMRMLSFGGSRRRLNSQPSEQGTITAENGAAGASGK
jgi:hypothetical protein